MMRRADGVSRFVRDLSKRIHLHPQALALIACIALASAMPVWQCWHDAPVLRDPTAMDQAQVARHVARGQGLQTSLIRPLAVALHPEWFREKLRPHPELYFPPVPLITAGFAMAVFGDEGGTVRWMAVLVFLATLLLTFALANELFGFAAGLMAMLIVAVNPYTLALCQAGSLRFVSVLSLTACLLWTLRSRSKPYSWKRAFALGLGWGLALLCDYTLAIPSLLVVLLQPWLHDRHRRKWLLWSSVGFVAALAPWLLRNWRVAGSPFASLAFYELTFGTRFSPGSTIFRSTEPVVSSALGLLLMHPRSNLLKWLANTGTFWEVVSQVASPLLIGFVIVLWLQRSLTEHQRKGIRLLSLVIAGVIASALVTVFAPERIIACAPLITVLAVGGLVLLTEAGVTHGAVIGRRWFWFELTPQSRRCLFYGLMVALCAWPLGARTLALPTPDTGRSPRFDQFAHYLTPDSVVASDVPWAVAWYGNRTAVWLPNLSQCNAQTGPSDWRAYDMQLRVDAVHISPLIFTYGRQEQMGAYPLIASGSEKLEGFQKPMWLREGGVLLLHNADSPNKQ